MIPAVLLLITNFMSKTKTDTAKLKKDLQGLLSIAIALTSESEQVQLDKLVSELARIQTGIASSLYDHG